MSLTSQECLWISSVSLVIRNGGKKETKEESWCLFVKGLHRPYEL
jgi:hypothetical protein